MNETGGGGVTGLQGSGGSLLGPSGGASSVGTGGTLGTAGGAISVSGGASPVTGGSSANGGQGSATCTNAGGSKCNGQKVETCISGTWQVVQSCPYGCTAVGDGATCSGSCVPAPRGCFNSTANQPGQVGLCNSTGVFVQEVSAFGGTCPASQLAGNESQSLRCLPGACTAGVTRCSSDTAMSCGYIETCDASGTFWTMPSTNASIMNQSQSACESVKTAATACTPTPGTCGCSAGYTNCAGTCVDTTSATLSTGSHMAGYENCGSCGHLCAPGQVCSGKKCVGTPSCSPGAQGCSCLSTTPKCNGALSCNEVSNICCSGTSCADISCPQGSRGCPCYVSDLCASPSLLQCVNGVCCNIADGICNR